MMAKAKISKMFMLEEHELFTKYWNIFLPGITPCIEDDNVSCVDFKSYTMILHPTRNLDCMEYAFFHELRHLMQYRCGYIQMDSDNFYHTWIHGKTIIPRMELAGWNEDYHLMPWERDANAFAYHMTGYIYDKNYQDAAMLYFPLYPKERP